MNTKIGERIAWLIAPHAVSLNTEYVQRLRTAYQDVRKKADFLERENKRLLREVMRWKKKARQHNGDSEQQ